MSRKIEQKEGGGQTYRHETWHCEGAYLSCHAANARDKRAE